MFWAEVKPWLRRELPAGRLSMKWPENQDSRPHYALHITQRGNYRQPVFDSDEDRECFLILVEHHADQLEV